MFSTKLLKNPLKKKLRTVVASAVVIGALALSACSGGGSGTDANGNVAIDFYYPIQVGGPLEEVMNGYVTKFEEQNPNIDVTPVYSGDYNQTLAAVRSAAQGGKTPSAAVLMSTEAFSLTDENLVTPISQLDNDQEWFDSFYPAFMENSKIGDDVIGLPFQRSTVVQYYNKDLFKKAGLDPNKPPKTWDELTNMGKTVQEKTGTQWGVQIPSNAPNGAWLLQALTIEQGHVLASEDGKSVAFNDPATVKALQFWADMGNSGLAPKGTIDWGTLPNDFAAGSTAVIWSTTGQLSNIKKQAKFDLGVSALPAGTEPGSPTGGGNFYVMADASKEQQDAAVKLGKFLTSPEIMANWTIESGYVATSPAAWDVPELADYAKEFPAATVARDQLDVAKRELATYRRGEVEDAINEAIGQVMNGSNPADVASETQGKIDDILAEFK